MTATPQTKPTKPPKPPQAKCSGCNHPASFHQKGHCMVMGCECEKWNGPKIPKKADRQ